MSLKNVRFQEYTLRTRPHRVNGALSPEQTSFSIISKLNGKHILATVFSNHFTARLSALFEFVVAVISWKEYIHTI